MKAVLLVGGLGTRLRSVLPDTAKPLASVGDGTFLALLVRQLRNQGITKLVMCTGYRSEQVEEAFEDGSSLGVAIEYSREESPLGTGGALALATPYLEGEAEFILMNGDSFVEVDFEQMIRSHHAHKGCLTMALRHVEDAGRYGTVHADQDKRISAFVEKTGLQQPGLVNAGVYVVSSDVLKALPAGASSLEKDVFPKLIERGMYGFDRTGVFIDIGTPEDLARAREMSEKLERSAAAISGQKSTR